MFGRSFSEYLHLARFGLLVITLMAIGRWILSLAGVPYQPRGNVIFSLVLATTFLSLSYGAFLRRGYGLRLVETLPVVFLIAVYAQLLIIISTFVSYGLGIDTYFNNPEAVTGMQQAVSAGAAVGPRIGGLIANTITSLIECCLGFWFGGLLPRQQISAPSQN